MIVKKIRCGNKQSVERYVKKVVSYIHRGGNNRILHTMSRNFISEDLNDKIKEMQSIARYAQAHSKPCVHYVLSWKPGEQPSIKQLQEATDIFLEEMGLQDHQCFSVAHKDTQIVHMHIFINRVDIETTRLITVNSRFDMKTAIKAVKRIEQDQGWSPVVSKSNKNQDERRSINMPYKVNVFETRTLEESVVRLSQRILSNVLSRVNNWQSLHVELKKHNMRYEPKGTGAVIWVNDIAIKASSACRDASFRKLTKRFGAFQHDANRDVISNDTVSKQCILNEESLNAISDKNLREILTRIYSGWQDFQKERQEYLARRSSIIDGILKEQNKVLEDKLKIIESYDNRLDADSMMKSREKYFKEKYAIKSIRREYRHKIMNATREMNKGYKSPRCYYDFELYLRDVKGDNALADRLRDLRYKILTQSLPVQSYTASVATSMTTSGSVSDDVDAIFMKAISESSWLSKFADTSKTRRELSKFTKIDFPGTSQPITTKKSENCIPKVDELVQKTKISETKTATQHETTQNTQKLQQSNQDDDDNNLESLLSP